MTNKTITPSSDPWALLTAESDPAVRMILGGVSGDLRNEFARVLDVIAERIDGDTDERAMRRHFGIYANAVVSLTSGDSADREDFRAYLGDPEMYSGGKVTLRSDTSRNLALVRLLEIAEQRREAAERALADAKADERAVGAILRGLCEACRARLAASGHAGRETPLQLDGRDVCDACVSVAVTRREEFRAAPKRLTW